MYSYRSKMGIKEIILLFVLLFVVSSPASSKPADKNMVSVHMQKNTRDEGIVPHRKFSHGSSGHVGGRAAGAGGGVNGGGRSTGAGGRVNGDGSNSPNTRGSGTSAVIPVYAAGGAAAGYRNNHRNAATCSHQCIGLPTLITAVLVYMLIYISVVFVT